MQITRRNFIQSAGCVTALVVAGNLIPSTFAQRRGDALYPIPPEVYSEPLFSMTADQFKSLIGRSFTAHAEEQRDVSLVLMEVNPLEYQQNIIRGYYGESFSLIFEAQGKTKLPQGRYEMTTDGLSGFTALIVPTGRRQRQFEIVVNRITR